MRKLYYFFFLISFGSVFAQQEKITVSFQDVTVVQAIEKIEAVSPYRFYFDPVWLANAEKVSGAFSQADAKLVLESLLRQTDLNFFADGNRIILVRNSEIYGELPADFFGKTASSADPDKTAAKATPFFYREIDSADRTLNDEKTIALIGKEHANANLKKATLTGYIRDAKTGAPISGIFLQTEGGINATTDENGFYSISVPKGQSTLSVRGLSYLTTNKKILAYSDGKLDIRIKENPNMLKEVYVKSNAKAAVKNTVTGVTTIDVEKIKTIPLILGERDIFKVAAALPGIKNVGEGSQGYSVRGGKEDQNLILLDDAVLYNPSHFLGFFSAVNPFTTATANIYKGSIPAEFGGRLSSVFDITSKKADTTKIAGEGAIGPVTSNLTVGIPVAKGKSGLLVGGRATYSDWILRSIKDDALKNSSASFYDFIVKYNHKIGKNDQIEAMGYYSRDKYSITSDSLYSYSNRLASLKWAHVFNEKSKGVLSFSNSEYVFNIDFEKGTPNDFDLGYKIAETQGAVKMDYKFNARHGIRYGLTAKTYKVQPGYLHPKGDDSQVISSQVQTEKALESALYVSDDFEVSEKLQVYAGLRYSLFAALGKSTQRIYQPGVPINEGTVTGEKTYGNNEVIKSYGGFEPRLSVRYLLGQDFSAKVGFDQTYQYLHLLSNNTTQSPTDTWKLSDLNVAPQRSQQFSVGLYKELRDGMFEVSAEGYYKRMKNILDYKTGAQLLLNQHVETELLQGQGKSYGVEFLIKKQSGRLNGWIGYTYSRAFIKLDSPFADNRVNNGDYFPANFDKPHDFTTVLNYKITQRYSFSANFVYQTGRPITYPIGLYQYNGIEYTLYSDRNRFRIPDYYRLDLGLNIEGNHKIKKLAHSFWNVSVYNVLGRNNPYSVFFVSQNGQVKAYKTSIFSIPVPTVTYNFKF